MSTHSSGAAASAAAARSQQGRHQGQDRARARTSLRVASVPLALITHTLSLPSFAGTIVKKGVEPECVRRGRLVLSERSVLNLSLMLNHCKGRQESDSRLVTTKWHIENGVRRGCPKYFFELYSNFNYNYYSNK